MPLIGLNLALKVLRARWLTVAAVVVAALAIAVAASMLLPKRYQATATVLLDVKSPDPISGTMMQGVLAPSYMNTQVDLLSSESVARGVARDLRLLEDPAFSGMWRDATQGKVSFDDWIVAWLAAGLEVSPTRDSNLMHVSFTADDPARAALMANAYVRAYVNRMLELRVEPARQYKQFFEVSGQQLRETMEAAQRRLSEFQQKNGLIGGDESLDVETARLNALNTELVVLQSRAADSAGRQQQASAGADRIPEALSNPVVSGLRGDLQRARSRLGELSTRLGERHPDVLQQKAQIAELEARVREETSRVAGSVDSSSRSDRQRSAEIQAAVDQQRAKVMRMKAARDEAKVLQRDVENAQRAYDAVLSRTSQMTLESRVSQTNALMVGEASPPTRAASPRPIRNLLAALILGLLGGVALAAIREVRDPRVRTDEQAIALLQQPVVVVLPRLVPAPANRRLKSNDPASRRQRRLIAG